MAIYMQYKGIDGDATQSGFQNWIKIESFQFGVGRGMVGRRVLRVGLVACLGDVLGLRGHDSLNELIDARFQRAELFVKVHARFLW